MGSASAVVKTVIDAKNAQKKLDEDRRHNEELGVIGKKVSRLYLKKTLKEDYGIFLNF